MPQRKFGSDGGSRRERKLKKIRVIEEKMGWFLKRERGMHPMGWELREERDARGMRESEERYSPMIFFI